MEKPQPNPTRCAAYPLGTHREEIYKVALGFLRTYRYLIQYELDLAVAKRSELSLVPPDIDWQRMSPFLEDLRWIEDENVSGRYQYGEIRLSRLNFYSLLLFRRRFYQYIPFQYVEYFNGLYAPVLFLFAILAIILNAIQVSATADELPQSSPDWVWGIYH